ncbi:MAG: 4'-phosphopantetheinyl transferase superfamily protein [Rhodobacteraceae bacterium]|jgi:enterobactin synthetase component D|nr:4'-phosphopantetheinyl transferase superfamily protein [Paracoccaceae bacterium]
MIDIGISTSGPFALPSLLWAELALDALPSNPTGLSACTIGPEGTFHIALPDDLAGAVPKRRREYLAGRLAAAHVLRRLVAPEMLGRQGRAPVWPPGIAGSISHDDRRAVAAASRVFRQLGVDCEQPIPETEAPALAREILAPGDAAAQPAGMAFGHFLTVVFSAKEAFYKAIAAEAGRMLDFHEVTLAGWAPDRLHLAWAGQGETVFWHLGPQGCTTLCVRGPA